MPKYKLEQRMDIESFNSIKLDYPIAKEWVIRQKIKQFMDELPFEVIEDMFNYNFTDPRQYTDLALQLHPDLKKDDQELVRSLKELNQIFIEIWI